MTRDKLLKELARELGADLSGLNQASDEALAHLLSCLRAAKARQAQTLRQAIDEGMSFVPALLRGTLRRILFP